MNLPNIMVSQKSLYLLLEFNCDNIAMKEFLLTFYAPLIGALLTVLLVVLCFYRVKQAKKRQNTAAHKQMYILLILASLIFTVISIINKIYTLQDQHMIDATWLIVLCIVIVPWCVLDTNKTIDAPPMKFILNYCAIIASAISIIFVCHTLSLQRRQLDESLALTKQMRDNEVLKHINEFVSPSMGELKEHCSQLKYRLMRKDEHDLAKKHLQYAIERSIYDDCAVDSNWDAFRESEEYKQYASAIVMIRFFNSISHEALSENTAHAVHFYYTAWRNFIYEITKIYNETWEKTDSTRRMLPFKADYAGACERLDSVMEKYNLPLGNETLPILDNDILPIK